ncbi:MAG: CBS domain-containing protein [Anaerolineae bacterium]
MKKGRTVLQAKRYGIHSCSANTSLLVAVRTMVDEEVSSLVVEDDEGCLLGLITRVDILRVHIGMDNWASQMVKDHMQRDIPVVTPQTLLADAALLMINSRSRQVVVVLEDGGKRRPVAMLTDGDLAYHMVKSN